MQGAGFGVWGLGVTAGKADGEAEPGAPCGVHLVQGRGYGLEC